MGTQKEATNGEIFSKSSLLNEIKTIKSKYVIISIVFRI